MIFVYINVKLRIDLTRNGIHFVEACPVIDEINVRGVNWEVQPKRSRDILFC